MPQPVLKAVIPAAGLGTRFLPATKAMPKEMLPLVDKPAIQYVVEEAAAAGLHDVLFVTGRNKNALENHFDRHAELEDRLRTGGKTQMLQAVTHATSLADIHYVRQKDPLGLGHAIFRSKMHVGDAPFAVLLGDDIVDSSEKLLERMIEVHYQTGGHVVALAEVEASMLHLYGVAEIEATQSEGVVKISGLVEKPVEGEAPSSFAVIGRYILQPEIFDVLERTEAGAGQEIQLTDALRECAQDASSCGVYGVIFRGKHYDTGDKLGYIKAIVEYASAREDIGDSLKQWLKCFVEEVATENK